MYSYKQFGNSIAVSINNHAEIVQAVAAFAKEHEIKAGTV